MIIIILKFLQYSRRNLNNYILEFLSSKKSYIYNIFYFLGINQIQINKDNAFIAQ